jgi:hypothetical protein
MTRDQQILLKRAQREAGLDDAEYRDAIEAATGIAGCRSSKDRRLTDVHIDRLLAYFEAIYWRKVDLGQLQAPCKSDSVYRVRGFWAARNTRQENSRDRYTRGRLAGQIAALEMALEQLGFGAAYCSGIRTKLGAAASTVQGLFLYRAALERTLRAKRRASNFRSADGQDDLAVLMTAVDNRSPSAV